MTDISRPTALLQRLQNWTSRLRPSPASERATKTLLMVAALLLFLGATWAGIANLPERSEPIAWEYIVVAVVVGAPLNVVLNAAEFRASAGLVGHRVSPRHAVEVAVLSTAANLLPIPGAMLVRAGALHRRGAPARTAASATAAIGIAWLGVTLLLAGALLRNRDGSLALAAILAGAIAMAAFAALVRALAVPGTRRRHAVAITVIEVGSVIVAAFRYYVILRALAAPTSFGQATALTIGAVVASALGLFPGGLGLREVLVAAIAPVVGVNAAISVVATAIDRILGVAVLAVLTVALLTGRSGASEPPRPGTEGASVPQEHDSRPRRGTR